MKWDTSSETLSRGLQRDVPAPLPLENMYIAGIPSYVAVSPLVPILSPFNGGVKHVQVNGATLFDGRYSGDINRTTFVYKNLLMLKHCGQLIIKVLLA